MKAEYSLLGRIENDGFLLGSLAFIPKRGSNQEILIFFQTGACLDGPLPLLHLYVMHRIGSLHGSYLLSVLCGSVSPAAGMQQLSAHPVLCIIMARAGHANFAGCVHKQPDKPPRTCKSLRLETWTHIFHQRKVQLPSGSYLLCLWESLSGWVGHL